MTEHYSLDGYVISANANLFNAIRALLPDASDPRVLDDGKGSFELSPPDAVNRDGNPVLAFMIRFNSDKKGDRDSILANIKGLEHIFDAQCLKGSWIGYHTCYNYADTVQPCNHKELYRKKWDGNSATTNHIIDGVIQ